MLFRYHLKTFFVLFLSSVTITCAWGNNLRVDNVERLPAPDRDKIAFTIAWDNSWNVAGAPANHDAAWIILKIRDCSSPDWNHGLLAMTSGDSGTSSSSAGHTLGSDLVFSRDIRDTNRLGNTNGGPHNTGVMVHRKTAGTGDIAPQACTLRVVGLSSGAAFDASTDYEIKVVGIEMVQVPTGPFFVGDGDGNSRNKLIRGNNNQAPKEITADFTSFNQYYRDDNNHGTVPANHPKGYHEFYCMKYEVSQGLYVTFLNTISTGANQRHFDNCHNNTNDRMRIFESGSGGFYTDRPDRACGCMNTRYRSEEGNFPAFLDWAALRPMSEYEYEKVCRGPQAPVAGEYAWGNSNRVIAQTINGPEDGTETIDEDGANINSERTSFSGGDGNEGPLGVGIFARDATTTREETGAAYYGAMEMSGNVRETVINVWDGRGRNYTGIWGDGVLDNAGLADAPDWPKSSNYFSNNGWGSRGSGWRENNDAQFRARVSDRDNAQDHTNGHRAYYGGRGVR